MRLADGRTVPDLHLDPEVVARCRALADAVSGQVLALVRRHTTTSIERTVLRLLGFHGAGPRGVPWVNVMVDELHARGLVGRGAAYWLGYVLRAGAHDPGRIVEKLAALPRTPAPLAPAEDAALRAELRREARAAAAELRRRVEGRDDLRRELGVGPRPHKYLIVATGNIFDDVEQARAAAQAGADVIAVIRSTAQSLLDYVPDGATTEGYGGTYATQENFRIMRQALDEESRRLRRYVHLTNYSSGLCMSEIAFAAAWERLDMLLNDAMYGILFRDINPRRTLCDQDFSRRICAFAGIVINTGEDNYITTADADEAAHTVIASQFVNESFAHRAGLPDRLIGLGHSFEIDPAREDTLARELAQALLVRTLFPEAPIKYMPPTKHKQGDIFFSHAYDTMADVVGQVTGQSIQLLGMMTEAMHNPFLMDRYVALKTADYVYRAWRSMGAEIRLDPEGVVARRARETLHRALALLEEVAAEGLFAAIAKARFGDVARTEEGGKGLAGVVERSADYFNPFLEILEGSA
ncbi:MAG TPA: lysine 5,6-aminomutase subunit alpha [Anaeromyxobacteraceae bacterium]|nr:lysine 5,6-aminomutase subunit alpha [Anaeromyxobacteraceae bacterium]